MLSGCGGHVGASPQPTAHPTAAPRISNPTPTPSPQPAAPTSTPQPTATVEASPTVQPTPTTPAPPAVTAASLRPQTADPGGNLQVTVTTSGSPTKVQLYIGSGAPNAPAPAAYSLTQTGTDTWTGAITAPSVSGQYQYSIGLFDASGRRHVVANDGWNLMVTGPAPTAVPQAQPLYADIPLAPPFSYGNPTSAVFSAEGRQVTGSEIVSTRRPDVTATSVAQYYSVHFPRSGWSIDPSTVPAAGATSFTMVATSGNRVCVVQFADFTVSIFYGTFAAGG